MRPLHRLETGTLPHRKAPGSCPIIAVIGGSAARQACGSHASAWDYCAGMMAKEWHRPLMMAERVKADEAPRPPVRPLHRLGIYTQHTIRYLDSCPIVVVVGRPGARQGVREGGNRLQVPASFWHDVTPSAAEKHQSARSTARRLARAGAFRVRDTIVCDVQSLARQSFQAAAF